MVLGPGEKAVPPMDIKELLDHMEKIPLLRCEVLAFFLKFKEKNKEMVANAFTPTDKADR